MRLNLFITAIIIICAIKTVPAQNSQHQFSHLDITHGLSNNQVNCIYKDTKGFMWFGTMAGLNRYDGYKFKILKNNILDTTSLSDDYIINITEGPFNKLWIQTRNGLNVYDPVTERFDRNINRTLANLSIPGNSISNIKKDRFGNFWFLHPVHGVYKYNPNTKKTIHFKHKTGDITSVYSNNPTDISEDLNGDFLLMYPNGLIEKINHRTNKIDQRIYNIQRISRYEQSTFRIFIDRQNDLWVFNVHNPHGIYYLNLKRNIFKHINTTSANSRLNADVVTNIIQDDKNTIWIATDNGGINLLNKDDFTIQYLVKREDNSKSLAQNATISLFKDNTGIVWIGTVKEGISYYHGDIIKFPLYKHYSSDPSSLGYDDINEFAEDKKGNLWIGTNGKGLIYFNRKTGTFSSYLHNASNSNSLSNNVIVSLCVDHENKLWIGTYFGGLDCYDGKTFTHYRHNSSISSSISDNSIYEIMEDSSHRLWIGTLSGGLNLLEPGKQVFKHYNKNDSPASILNNYISGLVEDEDKNIWIATSYGINVLLNKSHKFIYYLADPKNRNSLINDNVTNLIEDSRHLFWIATRNGLSIFDRSKKQFTNLRKEDGLPDNAILDILEDANHNMWVSTPNGLSNIIVTHQNGKLKFQFENYNEADGLQGRAFNENASLKTKKGELIFGGSHGFNIFNPSSIKLNKSTPNLILTDFQVYNKSINAGDTLNGHVILSKSISETKNITLKYNENAFSIEFADLNFFSPGKSKLDYKLDGFDKDWVATDTRIRKAIYTNLDPGNYVFRVRASNASGTWNTRDLTLRIKVLPPFWKSPIAYVIYVFSFIGILYYMRKQGIKKIETRFEFERVRKEAQHMHELDMMKIAFFTNISHEFRTPISLIMAPVEKLLKQADDKNSLRKLQVIHQNSRRLLNMINQLLDFSKMAVKKIQLDLQEADIITSIKEVCDLFIDVADKKQIKFSFKCDVDSKFVFFDQDKIEKVLFNLLSNAIKFTPDYGSVGVEVTLLESNSKEMTLLEIRVKDSGIGIPVEKHTKIFERFFQNDIPASLINQGSGIGLSITKEFVDLMGGTVSVESEQGKGSCFIVRLPLKLSQKSFTEIDDSPEEVEIHQPERLHHEKRNKNITILIVEDNPDFRAYLKDDLKNLYTVVEAINGKEGWQKALALHPDLIISDINMAEIDGIDFCKKIRSDKRTEHIPFILITAFTGDEKQLSGLETGANDYLTKPFNFDILRFKVHNLLKNQQLAKETYQRQIEAKPGDLEIETPDVKFMKQLLAVTEKNIPNHGFSVELLSSQMNMSRAALYNKVFNLSGKTPVEFIKSVRLKRAVQLLQTNQFSISEIAYQVGYNDAKYFSKAFKAEFLVTPSQYLDNID